MKVVKEPVIQFKCSSCGAENEGEPNEFETRETMPPSFYGRCTFCLWKNRVTHAALIASTSTGGAA